MKLVDILARELKAWPEGLECLSQLKGTGYIINGKGFDGRAFDALQIADETLVAGSIVTRAEWQAAVDALNAPKVVAWDGEGMPPVGSASCEYLGAHKYDEWTVVNIFAHYGHTVFVDFGDGWRAEDDSSRFRPIRTAEQVAAEEREKARTEVLNAMTKVKNEYEPEALWKFRLKVVGEMLDMGYRKEPKQCGS